MSIFRTNTSIFRTDIYTTTSDINIRTQGDDLKINLNGNHILSTGDTKLKNVYLLDENDGATYKKLYNDDTSLFWGDKSVLVDDDNITVSDITFSGSLKIDDITLQFPSTLGNEGYSLKTHADGYLYWGSASGGLINLEDTDIQLPEDNQLLKYSISTEKWINTSAITNITINDSSIGQTVPASGKFTNLQSLILHIDNDASINGNINLDGNLNIVGSIKDENENDLITFIPTPDAVNNIKITNNITGENPIISTTGIDDNIGLNFQSKGDASYNFLSTTDTATTINLYENVNNGNNKLSLKAPESLTTDIPFTFPDNIGVSGQVLTTDGNGNMSWSPSLTISNEGINRLITSDGVGGIEAESSLTFDGTDLNVYKAINDGNPTLNIGSSFAESLSIQSVYSGGGQSLDYVTFNTRTDQSDADKGTMIFSIDDTSIFSIIDQGINLGSGKKLYIDSEEILSNYAGVTTLKNINSIDSITNNTIKGGIDELSNLTSAPILETIGTITSGTWNADIVDVSYGGTGTDTLPQYRILIGDDTDPITTSESLTFDGNVLNVQADIQLDGNIIDQNHNELIEFFNDPNAVNHLAILNASSGDNPIFSATGDSNDIGLDFKVKNYGTYNFKATTETSTIINLYNNETNGNNTVSLTVPYFIPNSYSLTLPENTGTSGQVLITDGSGVTSWIDKPSLTNDSIYSIIVADGNGDLEGTNLTYNNSELKLYKTVDYGNPSFLIGSSDNETVVIQSIYDAGAQTLDKLIINTITQSTDPDKGKIELRVDDELIITIDDNGMIMREEGSFRIGYDVVLSETSGDITLSNIAVIDATTQNTIQDTINSLPSLNTVGTITSGTWNGSIIDVTYGGTGTSTFDANELLIGNGASQIITSNNLTFNGSVLGINADIELSGSIKDYLFNNELLKFSSSGASAINEITISNNTAGNNPIISATGDDSNIGLDFQVKGTGKYNFKGSATTSAELVLFENTINGTNTITIKTPANILANYILTLPDDDGNVDQVLKTDGAGNLSWSDQSTLNITNAGNNRITTSDGASGLVGEANLLFDGTSLSQYLATNDGNPIYSIGASTTESLIIQSIYDTGAQTLDKVMFTTKAASASIDKGKFEFYVDDVLVSSLVDSGLTIKASGTLAFGSIPIITDSGGTTTLSNIDAIDATTEATLEAAIDTLTNLISIGTITTGTWNATSITVPYGGTGTSSFTTGGLLIGNGTSAVSASSALTYSSSILNLAASSKIAIGSVLIIDDTSGTTTLSNIDAIDATTEATLEAAIDSLTNLTSIGTITTGTWNGTVISPVYGGTGATSFTTGGLLIGNNTSAVSASSNLTYSSSILNLAASSKIAIGSVNIIDDTSGTTTLSNIDAIDATTEATLEAAIDTLTNLTSIGTITTGTWNGSIISPTYGGTGVSSLSSITALNGLNTIGTITTGTWNGTSITVPYGGTGTTSFTTGGILIGNNTSAVSASSALTYSSSILNLAASSKIAIGSVLIIDDTSGTTTLKNIDAIDATTEATLEAAIDTLSNLTSIGTISTGTWNASDIGVPYGGTGRSSLANNSILTGNGTSGIIAEANLTFDGSLLYVNGDMRISGNILGASGDIALAFTDLGGTSYFEIINDNGANSPILSAYGVSANVDMILQAKGTGSFKLYSTSTTSAELHLFHRNIYGDASVSFKAPDNLTSGSYSLTLPIDAGTPAQVLSTDGNGVLSWVNSGSSISIDNDGDNRIITATGSNGLNGEANLLFDGTSLSQYLATNDGNPTYSIGASATESFNIQTIYDTGAQSLDKVKFTTKAADASANKGKFEFYVDEALITTFNDDGIIIASSGKLTFGSISILSDVSGTTTLENIDAIDATTEATLEAAIDSLTNLSSIGTITTGTWNATSITVPYGGTGATSFTTGGLLIGNNTSALSASSALTYSSSILNLAASSKIAIGSISIIDDSGGTTTLSNIDAIDATTEATLEAAIDTLSNLTSIGTITTGTWNGSSITVPYGGTGQTSLASDSILTGNGTSGIVAEATFKYSGIDLTQYIATNDGNPTYSIGASSTESFNIETIYDTGQQTLDKVMFTTKAASTSADKGKFEFYVDDVLVSSLVDDGLTIKASGTLAFGAIPIITDSSGTTTLSNIDAIDATTEATIEAAIDTLSNLTSIGTITTGTWNGTVISPTYGGTGVTTLSSITALSGLNTIGTITTGTWNGTSITVPYGGTGATSFTTGGLLIGNNTSSLSASSALTYASSILNLAASSKIAIGTINIIDDTSGTTTLSNIDAIDATTEATLEAAIDTLSNLTSIGTITTGTWNGTVIGVPYGGTGQSSLTSDSIITGNGTSGIVAEATFKYSGIDLTQYIATNDGNPTYSLGASSTESLTIQSVYDTGQQTLDKVMFTTKAASASADKGKFEFYVDDTLVNTINDDGLMIRASGTLAFGAIPIITDSSGTTTLSNIDAIDATTESTLEAAIDSLTNLTSIGTITTGTWNGTVISPTYGGTGVTTLSSITALSGLNTIGTITTGTWNATAITVPYGGTGASSFTTGGLLIGNNTSALSASSALTYSSSILNLAASSKIAIGSVNIIDDSSGTTTLSNIDAIDATTEATLEAAIDTLSNLTSIGTITTGTWNGSVISVPYGGTGVSSLTSDSILTGNGTSGIVAESNLTFNGSVLGVTGDIRLSGSILDTNNNELLKFATIGSAVNEVTISNNIAGQAPIISATGNDTNIALQLKSKGTGLIQHYVNSNIIQEIGASYVKNYNELRLTNGSNNISFSTPVSIPSSYNAILPSTAGLVGQTMIVSGVAGSDLTLSYGTPTYGYNTISANTNAAVNIVYLCNTSAGSFTVTLPSAPTVGSVISLIDSTSSFSTYNLVVSRGGSDVLYVNTETASATSIAVSTNNTKITCEYVASGRWTISYPYTHGIKVALLRDEQAKNTSGGSSTAAAWNTRTINTEYDPDNIVSISSNLFTLLPGKYLIEAYTSGFVDDRHKAALYTSGGTLIQMGSSEYSGNGNYAATDSRIIAILNISTSTTYTVKHYTTFGSNARNFGVESNINDANGVAAVEVYTDIKITKYDEPIITNVSSLLNYYNRNTISTTTNPLVVNTIYSCDTSGGAFTVTLPSSPAQGDYIELIDANGTFNTNNLTIAAAGSYIFANSSTTGTASLVIGITNCKIKCTYTNTNRWCLEYINATGIKYAIVRDEKVKNTDGGTNASTPFWNTRTINTEYDPHNIVTLTGGTTGVGGTANAFILEPGNYLINVKTLVEQIRYYRVELFDVTSNTPVTNGINNFTSASNDVSGVGLLDYILHISTTTTYSIKLYASQVASNYGLGSKLNINTSAGTNTPANYEVYTILQITKYDDPITSGVVSVLNTYNRNTISTTTNPLAVNTIYSCNTNGGAFTVTLPSSAPAQGDYIELIDANGTFGTNNLTINTGGSHQMYVNTNTVGATSLVITANNAKIKCTYANTNRWCVEYQNAIGVKMAVLKEEQSQNVSGGTPTSGANSNIRVLNTKYDPDGIVTISSNVFTLQPGKYNIRASAPAASASYTKISLYSGTNATSPTYNVLEETGTSDFVISSGEMRSFLSSLQNLSTAKSFIIRHTVASATATVGLGAPTNINNVNGVSQVEVYAMVEIMKYDDPISTGVVSLLPSAYTNKLAITSSLTLAVNTYYYITSSGTYTLTLPASPSLGDMIEITDGTGALASNVATVTRAGSQNILIGDVSVTSFDMNRNGMKCKLEYINTNRWAMTTATNQGIWQTYTLTWGAVTTPPTMPTTVLKNVASYTVVGKMLYIHYDYYHSSAAGAAAGSGSYLFPLPPGYTMAASITASDTLTSSLNRFALGSGYVLSTNTSSTTILQCIAYNSTKIILLWTSGTSSSYIGSSSVPMTGAPYSLSFNVCIPLD